MNSRSREKDAHHHKDDGDQNNNRWPQAIFSSYTPLNILREYILQEHIHDDFKEVGVRYPYLIKETKN